MTQRMAIGLQDVSPDIDPVIAMQELFTFSPFGLGCRQCTNTLTIQLDKRCIARHLKKHGMDSRVATVSSLFDTFQTQLDLAKASESIEPYRSDKYTYMGYSCMCGQNFHSRKGSAIRHCRRLGCDPAKLQTIELFKLRCGRYVSQSQVTKLFEDRLPRITKQFNYCDARATLLPDVIVGLEDLPATVTPPPILPLNISLLSLHLVSTVDNARRAQ